MKHYITGTLVYLAGVLLLGCGKNPVRSRLAEIETFAESNPDSARRSLEAIDPSFLNTRRLQAQHALMLSTALSRCKIKVADDSLISIAVRYFGVHGPQKEKFLSYYYRGRIYDDLGDDEAAMQNYIEAENVRSKDISLRYKTSLQLKKGDIYKRLFAYEEALVAYRKAGDYALACDWIQNFAASALGSAAVYFSIPDYGRADSCLNAVIPYHSRMDRKRLRDYYDFRLHHLIATNGHRDSIQAMALFVDKEYSSMPSFSWYNLALAYVRCGNLERAQYALDRYEESLDTPTKEARYYLVLSELKDSLHQYSESLEAFKRYHEYQSSNAFQGLRSSTKYVEQQAFHQRKEHLLFRWISIGSLVAVLLIAGLSIILKKNKRQKVEVNHLYLSLKEEQEGLASLLREHSELQERARDILGKRVKALGQFLAVDRPKSLDRVSDRLDSLTENRRELLETIGMLYAVYHPAFVSELMDKNLSTTEIGYCCLLQLGFRTGEIGDVINRSGTYNISSAIRQKLGLGPKDTNLSIYIKELFRSSGI